MRPREGSHKFHIHTEGIDKWLTARLNSPKPKRRRVVRTIAIALGNPFGDCFRIARWGVLRSNRGGVQAYTRAPTEVTLKEVNLPPRFDPPLPLRILERAFSEP